MTFNGIEYKLKENNLAINQASIPLLIKYRKLQAEYLDDIDISLVNAYDNRINELETAVKQLKELDNEQEVIDAEERLKEVKEQKANDEEVQIIAKMKNDIEALILTELSLDTVLMSKLFSKILIGDTSKIDYEHSDYRMFAMEVLAGFFTLMQLNKNGLLN
jgi:hypothetical protein